jgi:Septum formation/Domain of unknown function (DUF4190)
MTQPPAGPPYPPQPPVEPPYPPPPPGGQYPQPGGQYAAPYPPPVPGYGMQPGPQAQTTSGFAVASLVLGILGACLLSIPFGILGLMRTKPGGQKGRGMAIAGLVLSGLWLAAVVAAIVGGAFSSTHTTSVRNIRTGDCWADLPVGNRIKEVNTTSCDRPHSAEVVGVLTMKGGSFPPQSVLDEYRQKCRSALSSYSSTALDDSSGISLAFMPPTQQSWNKGDREMVCIATFSSPRTGSIKS